MKNPVLILIHGLPATGKTTLGRKIAAVINLPFFCRDDYKEELFDLLGEQDGSTDWSRKIGAASFLVVYSTIERVLAAGQSCIAETYWTPEFAEPRLSEITKNTGARIVQVFCSSDERIRRQRFVDRANSDRHPAHMDTKRLEEGIYDNSWAYNAKNFPLNIEGDLIKINTSDFSKINTQEIIEQIRAAIA